MFIAVFSRNPRRVSCLSTDFVMRPGEGGLCAPSAPPSNDAMMAQGLRSYKFAEMTPAGAAPRGTGWCGLPDRRLASGDNRAGVGPEAVMNSSDNSAAATYLVQLCAIQRRVMACRTNFCLYDRVIAPQEAHSRYLAR